MTVIRGLLAVVVGYLVMIACSMAAVARLFAEGAPEPEFGTLAGVMVAMGLGAAIGGFVATLILGIANSPWIYVTIGVVWAVLGRAYFMGVGIEPAWYKLVSAAVLAVGFLVGASTAAYKMERG